MWFLGIVVGLILGALFQSMGMAILLAVGGAIVFPQLFGKKARKAKVAQTPVQATLLRQDDAENPFPGERQKESSLEQQVAALTRRVFALEQRLAGGSVAVTPATTPALQPVVTQADVPASQPLPAAETQAGQALPAQAAAMPARTAAASAVIASQADSPAQSSLALPAVNAQAASPTPVSAPSLPPAQPVRRPPPPPPPPVPLKDRLPAPLAKLIFGGNTLVKLGVLILFLGLAFLLRYTAERVTVPVELRYAAVALVGAGLLGLGWFLRHKRAGYALILQGAGIGVFYLTTLAAMKLSGLLPATIGFAFLFGVAVLSAVLAVVQNAPVLAIVAVLEGFAAPVLASTGQNRPVGLFTYLLILDIGIMLVAWFKAWRLLNLIGFVGTFTLAAGWAQRYYTDDQFGTVEPFLIVFFLLFTAIGLFFARRTLADAPNDSAQPLATRAANTLRRVGRVDSALVFGVPMVAFGLQYLLMKPFEYGAAFSAMALAAFYLVLGRIVFSTQPKGLALLAEAYAIAGVIFGTLAIPLGLEGQWTGASWAVEAAGMYWLGARQQRPYARAFSFLVLLGAAYKLLQDTRFEVTRDTLLQGSVIGPLMLAAGAFVMWAMHRRSQLDKGKPWEAMAGTALPWIGMGALTLLQWQWWTPAWAAAATAVLASAAFAVAVRFSLQTLPAVSAGMQALAVAGFVATLHRGTDGLALASGNAAVPSAWQGAMAAGLIALSVLGSAAWSMAQAHRAALARGVQPVWSVGNIIAVLTGTGLLHLTMLFQLSLEQAALVWPLTATVVLWVALRTAHGPLAAMAAALHAVAAALLLTQGGADREVTAAFGNLSFWTAVVLGLTALLAGDWIRDQASPRAVGATRRRWANAWCASPAALWTPVAWGLTWWMLALLVESSRVLARNGLTPYITAACLAAVLGTSAIAYAVARRRDWLQLGRATLATLPGLTLVALQGGFNGIAAYYVPSTGLGWIAWPLAALWHLRLLRGQTRWVGTSLLGKFHIAGLWLFMLLAARECQWQFGWLAGEGDDWSSWSLLGWVLVPAIALWAMRSAALLRRWPLSDFRHAYLEVAAVPVAAYLLAWAWLTNLVSPGGASPLPYVPLLNPLELAHWLVLFALLLWWRALPATSPSRVPPAVAKGVFGATGLALLTGMVLRTCHHYAGVPWSQDALYASWLTQAALSITWALCGVAAMVLGHGRALRPVWMAGAALLGVVVLKLFFVELADRGGLFRIVSFIGVGALLLLVGYFAPVPPAKTQAAAKPEGETA